MQEYNVVVYENHTEWRNKDGKLHRLDGPAIECSNGDKFWWAIGKLHRSDGPAVDRHSKYKAWWVNGKRHRLDGPAIENTDGDKEWYIDGMRHRLDGPAVELANGDKAWYIEGEELTEEEFLKRTSQPKKVTISEIEELFGCKVEIVNDRTA